MNCLFIPAITLHRRMMEEVFLKAEPIDEEYNTCFYIKTEDGIDIDATATHQSTAMVSSTNACVKVIDELEQIECPDASTECELLQLPQNSKQKSSRTGRRKAIKESDDESYAPKQGNRKKSARSKGPLVCDECGKEFKSMYNLKRHALTHRKPLTCDECGKEFKAMYYLNRHKVKHSAAKPYVCTECGAAFAQNFSLKTHQLTHMANSQRYCCESCGKKFHSKSYLQVHQRSKHTGERPYVCECGEAFTQKAGLVRHKLEHADKQFQCSECGMRFFENKLLKSHIKIHTDGRAFTCAECGKGFYHKASLEAHKRSHLKERPFGCEVCGKRFTQMGGLRIHKVIHSDVRPYGCDVCGLRFTQKFTLKSHQIKQHGYVSTSESKQLKTTVSSAEVASSIRDDNVSSSGDYHDNDVTHSSEKWDRESVSPLDNLTELDRPLTTEIYQPDDANESGMNPSLMSKSEADSNIDELNVFEEKFATTMLQSGSTTTMLQSGSVHEMILEEIKAEPANIEQPIVMKTERLTATGDNSNMSSGKTKKRIAKRNSSGKTRNSSVNLPFACGKCDETFSTAKSLKVHQRSHKPAKPFICDECGKTFRLKQGLRIHKRVHSGIRPYTCELCNKSFTQQSSYITHKRLHTGEKRFSCDLCDRKFSAKATMLVHLTSHSKIKAYGCHMCEKKFAYSSTLKKHIKIGHGGEKRYICDLCGKKFFEKATIAYHMRSHAGLKPFFCDECPSKFISKSELQQHKRWSHRPVGVPSPYQRRKLLKLMNGMDADTI